MKTIIRLANERDELRVVADQFGRPTYAGDLARLIARLVQGPAAAAGVPFGTYHAVGGAVTSWHGFAEVIVQTALRSGLLSREPVVRADLDIRVPDGGTAAARTRASNRARSCFQPPTWVSTGSRGCARPCGRAPAASATLPGERARHLRSSGGTETSGVLLHRRRADVREAAFGAGRGNGRHDEEPAPRRELLDDVACEPGILEDGRAAGTCPRSFPSRRDSRGDC